jgi:acyl-CoA reductase-like NAD-dependent aldehyde dehydrogenase
VVGGLIVNGSSNFRLDHVPFGGVKDSGFGRETPRSMIEDFTVVKTLMLRGLSVWGEANDAR